MNKLISSYKTIIFDCDGVILNSNRLKTDAFYEAALPYGYQAARALVKYHVENGGISRYDKFKHFLNEMIPPGVDGPNLDRMLATYVKHVKNGLLLCEVADRLSVLRKYTLASRWMVVSGGDQNELREVFDRLELTNFFDAGIYGSPESKSDILDRELKSGNILLPALFLGDSKYDHMAAKKAGLDFIFISGWTELSNWEQYCDNNSIKYYKYIKNLINL